MKEVERDFLTEEELQKIYNKRFSSERLQLVKDIFFLSCYAGLAYVDVKGLKKDHVGIGIDGEKWIFKNLQNEPDSTYKKINIQLERRLKNNCHHLDYLLFFPKRKTEKPQIIITANGNPLYFSYVENLVKAAPKIKNMNTNLIAWINNKKSQPIAGQDTHLNPNDQKKKLDIIVYLKDYTIYCDNNILLEAIFMILYDLLGEKSMVEDLNFVQLGQIPENDTGILQLYELKWYIDRLNTR